jgi:hypothetical protein
MKEIVGGLDIMVDYYHGRSIASWVTEHPSIILWVRQRCKRPISEAYRVIRRRKDPVSTSAF